MQEIAQTKHALDSMTQVGLRAFSEIADLWKLTPEQKAMILGRQSGIGLADQSKSESSEPHLTEVIIRISYVLGIYKQLNILLPIPARADAWIRKQNSEKLFNGASALDFVLKDPEHHLPLLLAYLKNVI